MKVRAVIRALRGIGDRSRLDRDTEEELRFHIEHRAEDLQRTGLSSEQAMRQARLEFGA